MTRALPILAAVAIASGCGDRDDAMGEASTSPGGSADDDGGNAPADDDGADNDGGGGTPPLGSSECELGIGISGAVTWSTPSTPACGIPFGPQTGIFMGYLFLDGAIQSVQIDVADVTEGETGTFPAAMTLTHVDGRTWTTEACRVVIQSHVPDPEFDDDFSRAYRVHAMGSCTDPAADEAGLETVIVDPFALRFPARWA